MQVNKHRLSLFLQVSFIFENVNYFFDTEYCTSISYHKFCSIRFAVCIILKKHAAKNIPKSFVELKQSKRQALYLRRLICGFFFVFWKGHN